MADKVILTDQFRKYYDMLNPAQREAVDTIEGPVLVLAGPGTGKTQTIALRIAKILKETQVNPSNILCLTFTETAVANMRSRLLEIIGKPAYQVQIHTFHSFCNDIIQNHKEMFPELGQDAENITEVEKVELIKELIDKRTVESELKPFGNPYLYLHEIAGKISALKREGIDVEAFANAVARQIEFFEKTETIFEDLKSIHYASLEDDSFLEFLEAIKAAGFADFPLYKVMENLIETRFSDFPMDEKARSKARTNLRREILKVFKSYNSETSFKKQQELQEFYQEYQEELRARGRYDYEDMIMFVIKKLAEDESLLRSYQEQYQYILVDEYQDTNTAQNETIRLLGSFFDNPNIFVVGDDDQAIYRFQGASLENINYFYSLYKDSINVVVLTDNYRSHQRILDASAGLIKHNKGRIIDLIEGIDKDLLAKRNFPKSEVSFVEFDYEYSEFAYIATKVKELLESGVKEEEIAILFRENKDADVIADVLAKKGIKFSLVRGEDILEDINIQQFIDLMGYLVDPVDDYKLFSILNFEFLGISGADTLKLYRFASHNGLNVGEVLSSAKYLQEAEIDDTTTLGQLADDIIRWQKLIHNSDSIIFFNTLLRESGFLEYILGKEDKLLKLQKLNRLYTELKTLDAAHHDYTIKEFIRHLSLAEEYHVDLSLKQRGAEDFVGIRMMTAHSAKGLEFEHVFIARSVNNKWGNRRSRDKIKFPLGMLSTEGFAEDDNEEERRLFYVAMTRAKTHIYILHSNTSEEEREFTPSQFVSEAMSEQASTQKLTSSDEDKIIELGDVLGGVADFNVTEQGRKLLEKLLENYRLSVTHLNSYQLCPRCFFYNIILKLPKLKEKHLVFGTAIHNVMRDIQVALNEKNKTPSIDELIKSYESYVNMEKLEADVKQDVLINGKQIISDFVESRISTFKQGSETEYSFGKHGIFIDEVPVTGKIDRVDFLDDKQSVVQVIDYKTGNPDYKYKELKQEDMGDYFKQLVFYKLLIDNSAFVNWEVKKGIIEFVEKSKRKNEFVSREFEITADDEAKLKEEIKQTYAKILNAEFEECNDKDCYTPELHNIPFSI